MKLFKTFIAVLLIAGSLNAANAETQDRRLSGFHAINVAGSFDVLIKQGSAESVVVDAPSDVMAYVLTEVNNGTLKIYNKNRTGWGNLFNNKKITVYVTIKTVDEIAITGSGDASFKNGVNANALRLAITGSGDIEGKVSAKTLDAKITGSGDMKVWGTATDTRVSITGSGEYSGRDLVTTNTTASVSGSGDISVNVNGSLNARVAGSGDIHYSGHPKNVLKSKSGSGDISGS